MSKQDIEKRLGFAAQGVKETTRSSEKAKMAKRMVVDTITSGNQKHELGYESVMQPVAAGEPPHEWFRPIVRTTNLDTGKSSEKASQPHYTEKSARDWLKNYASSVKPSTDPLYAEYASNREKISKMMTRLAQARNNPELRQKLQAESDKLDARQREVAAQLQKRKSSRPGAKAKFVRIVTTPQGRYTTNLDKNTRAPIEGGKGYVMVDPAQYITPKRVRVQGTKGEIEVRAIVEGKEIVGVSAKLVSARPGVKAKFEKEYVLWGLPKGETDAIHQQVLSTQAKTPAQMEDVKKRAAAAGWHSFRVQILDLSKPYKGFARPGVKAKMGRAEKVLSDGSVSLDFTEAKEWLSTVSDEALKYIISDSNAAAKAMGSGGKKFNYYTDLALTAAQMLRSTKRGGHRLNSSRPSAKAKMENSDGNYFMISGYVDNSILGNRTFDTQAEAEYYGKRMLESLKKDNPKAKDVNVQISKVIKYSPQTPFKTLSLRPGAKAKA